jgi:WD40 repeat protein
VRLWSSAAGELLATLHGHIGAVYGVVVSEEGRLLASGGADGTVRLWSFDEPRSGQPMLTLQAHSGELESLAIDAAQRVLASCGQDGLVRLWDAASGACLRTLRGDRHYQRLEISGLTGVTEAQRAALLALGAFEAPA